MLNRKIKFFISVVENGSFSKAAKELYLSQSAISQQIVLLEDELGVELFNREGYRPILTEAGKYYYDKCKKIIDEYKDIEENTKKIALSEKKRLRIGITGPLEKNHLPLIINEYKKIYKDVFVELKKVKFKNGVEQLENEKLDICFNIQNEFRISDKIKTVKLLKHQVCIICSREHPWANKSYIESSEIGNEPIISFGKRFGELFYLDFIESFKKDGIAPNIVQEVEELEELLMAVKINQGIGLISREVVEDNDDIHMIDIINTHHNADYCIGYIENNDKEKDFIKEFINITGNYFMKLYKKK